MNENFALMIAEALRTQESREERAYVRSWVGRILVLLAILGTTIYATGAYAGTLVYRDAGGNSLTLTEEPCSLGGWFAKWKKALWVWNGESQEACWSMQATASGPMVMVVDSAGDNGAVPPQLFKEEQGV